MTRILSHNNSRQRASSLPRILDEDAVDGAGAVDAEKIGVLRVDRIRQAGDRLRNRALFGIAVFDHQIVAGLQDRIDMLEEARQLAVKILDQKARSSELDV